jgi:hypothetical protein
MQREGEARAEPRLSNGLRLGRSLALAGVGVGVEF